MYYANIVRDHRRATHGRRLACTTRQRPKPLRQSVAENGYRRISSKAEQINNFVRQTDHDLPDLYRTDNWAGTHVQIMHIILQIIT